MYYMSINMYRKPYYYLTLGQSRVAVLPVGEAGLGGELVVLLAVHVLRAHLDVSGVYAGPRGFGRVEGKCYSTDLREPSIQLWPL